MFADIWIAVRKQEVKTQLDASLEELAQAREEAKQACEEAKQACEEAKQAREELNQALVREQRAEELASRYQRELSQSQQELDETRRQMKTYHNKVFWEILGARFPSIPTSTSSRITQVANYSQTLLKAAVSASSIEDFDASLDAYPATP